MIAIYHFLLGFTAKAAGTETGVTEPEPTFSACFAAPFLPLRPEIYGKLLKEKIDEVNSKCWLVNTGWTGGPYGVGKRMPIRDTRAVLTAVLNDTIGDAGFRMDKNFGFEVPVSVKGINSKVLIPRDTWPTGFEYDKQAQKLLKMFSNKFLDYRDKVDQSILDTAL